MNDRLRTFLPVVVSTVLSMVLAAWVVGRLVGTLEQRTENNGNRIERLEALDLGDVKGNILEAFPAGTILVAYDKLNPTVTFGEDWVRCGDADGTPVLEGRFLVGATHQDVGEEVGEPTHRHLVSGGTGWEDEGHKTQSPEGADNETGYPNWQHRHTMEFLSVEASHLPPARKVLFLCKVPADP